MNKHVYVFEELQPFKGIELYVHGEATMTYSEYDAEPDVGIMSGGYEYEIEQIIIYSSDAKKNPDKILDNKSELYKLIEEALTDIDYQRYVSDDIDESVGADY